MAFSVHAERHLRLRCGADPGAGRSDVEQSDHNDDLGQSKRFLLRPGSRHGKFLLDVRLSKSTGPAGWTTRPARYLRLNRRVSRLIRECKAALTGIRRLIVRRRPLLPFGLEKLCGVGFFQRGGYVPIPGQQFLGGGFRCRSRAHQILVCEASSINSYTESAGHGSVMALDIRTGQKKWKFDMRDVTDSGLLTTASEPAVHRRP